MLDVVAGRVGSAVGDGVSGRWGTVGAAAGGAVGMTGRAGIAVGASGRAGIAAGGVSGRGGCWGVA
ncbi:MAG: hypothetical protein FWC59_02845 [Actinomycetia bacterium]|nr:hypothetical protein [Actinomycetes bacterium]